MPNISSLPLATDDASDRSLSEGARPRKTGTPKALSPVRKAAAPLAARVIARGVSEVEGGAAGVARKIGVSPTMVARWSDDTEDYGKPMTLRDIVATGPALMRAVGRELIAQADAVESDRPLIKRSPAEHALRLGAAVGDLHHLVSEIMADGIVDATEARRLRLAIRDLLTAARKAKRDAEPTV